MTDQAKRAGPTLKCHWCGNQLLPNNLEIRCEICSEQFTLDHVCGVSGLAAECERLREELATAKGFIINMLHANLLDQAEREREVAGD